ncbi:MAG: hypothetical protein HY434_02565 [Candidatus Liptonbacteria bacterium]|nr:hypothetical protein [Candidatus Liptonbacteria bacterium]
MESGNIVNSLVGFWWVVPLVALLVGYKLTLRVFGVVMIGDDALGIVTKKFVVFGKNRTLPDGAIVALNGEAGIQADTLAPGVHFWLWPWQYTVNRQRFTVVQQGHVGVVQSRDGRAVTNGRVLGKTVECNAFQDARAFLTNGGERGPQIAIIPPGTYRINTALFSVNDEPATEIKDNMVGVITTKDGKPLPTGEIAGREVADHDMFQDAQAFIANGGYKGLQEQVLLAGRYYLNPLFATVEIKPMTDVEIAHVGVVIAYVGNTGVDLTGETFKHGNLVSRGEKGVWLEPLDPGKYPINPYTHHVETVPTANVVLNWATGKTESHKLDEKLSTITVRSSDGFTFNLDVSQIIHVPRNEAPKVIARFGSMANLVTQVLEPTIGNYFRNAAQKSDVIEFLTSRSERQEEARQSIKHALEEYNVNAVDTLIGDITPPEALMKTLTDRKIAEQEKQTFVVQKEAEINRKELQQAKAMADTQPEVVNSERKVAIADFNAQATVKTAEGNARSKTLNAAADAEVTRVNGEAEAGKTRAVGTAEADVIKLKINSMQSGNYALIETAKALGQAKQKFVPEIVASGGGEKGGTLVDVLIATLLANNNGNGLNGKTAALAAEPGTTNPGGGADVPAAPAQ